MKKKLLLSLFLFVALITITGCGNKKEKVKITDAVTKTIEYEDYDNGLVSLKIPKGWKVEVYPTDYIHYSFKVTNPEDSDYMLLFGLKLEGFFKSALAKETWNNYYPTSPLSKLPALPELTTSGFYSIWNDVSEIVNADYKGYFPLVSDFNVIETLGQSPMLGGDILRVNYTSENNKKVQGVVTATVKDVGSYYVNVNFNPFSDKVDVWPLNVYNVVLLTAPDEEFNNWYSILDNCLGSIEFSETFLKGFSNEETTLVSTIQANQKIYDGISDMIMDSWEKRNNSYDIISQKQSDATLGYERVYDTETGEVYKAYNGFTDSYKGERYKAITDDMYTKSISGYIEK